MELDLLLKELEYFSRISPRERFQTVKREIPSMRDAGAFMEYPASTAPRPVEGVHNSHAEPSDTPGMKRLYLFYDEDYPELAHHTFVERERAREAYVRVYEFINGPIE